MSCPPANHLSAYHDGELDAAARADIEHHIAACPACATELASLSAMSQMFATTDRPHLSQFANHRLRLHAEGLVESEALRLVRTVRAIAACVLAAASIWLWLFTGSPAMPDTEALATSQIAAPPPQLDVAVTASAETQSLDTTTPAAAWYLADISSRSDDYAEAIPPSKAGE